MRTELDVRREEFARRFDGVRDTVEEQFGWRPRPGKWVWALAAGAMGLWAGLAVTRQLRGRRPRRLGR